MVQKKMEKAMKWGREGGEDFAVGEGRRNSKRGRSVRDEQKPVPSDAQEHVSATEPQPQSGLQDPECTEVIQLGTTGMEPGASGEVGAEGGEGGWMQEVQSREDDGKTGRGNAVCMCLPVNSVS